MAEEKSKDQGKGKAPLSARFAIFMVLVTAVVFLPSTIVISACMIPTLIAAIVDTTPGRTAWMTVGAMNTAGTVPIWFSLLDSDNTILGAFHLVFQPTTILLAFGAAGLGWIIHYNVTPFVAMMVVSKNERRLKVIDKRQKELVSKWGEEVSSPQ